MNERSIFMEALEKGAVAQRSSYLDEACAGDSELRQRVQALLKSHEEAADFLGKLAPERLVEDLAAQHTETETRGTTPTGGGGDDALEFLAPSEQSGSLGRLGHYEVQEVIGRGGMGIVFRALDKKLHRVVAIKVMAPQLAASATARKRFT